MESKDQPNGLESPTKALSRELSEFLVEFSIGVHRYAMYPLDHPALGRAGKYVLERLQALLVSRGDLSIGVAQAQLIIDGVATDSKHPVLGDLARRLHGHQLGGITFFRGAGQGDVVELLRTLAQDSERDGEPLGLLPPEQLPRWEKIRLYPLGYDKLELKDEGSGAGSEPDRAAHLWIGLARSAMASEDLSDPDDPPDPETVARSIQAHHPEAAYDQVIVGYLLQLAEELKDGTGAEAEAVRERVSGLIRAMDEETLGRIVEMGGRRDQQRNFILNANQSLAVDSVVKILQAAAGASQQEISTSLTRLLTKLSAHAEAGPPQVRDQANMALRDNVEGLLKDWELIDPNPERYSAILDAMAQAVPLFETGPEGGGVPGSQRILQMSIEMDVWGPMVQDAVEGLLAEGDLGFLLEIGDSAPEGNGVAHRLLTMVTSEDVLRGILDGGGAEDHALQSLVRRIGESSLPILLDTLAESESRSVRRAVFDALADSDLSVGSALEGRLEDTRWYVLRNLLSLIRKIPSPPEWFSARAFLGHEDLRVRREAFPLAFQDPTLRERALALALADDDERILRLALAEGQEGISDALLPILMSRVVTAPHPPGLRALGVKVLGTSATPRALEALLDISTAGKARRGRVRIAPSSPEVLEAIRVLKERWGGEASVVALLTAARKSKSSEVRDLALGREDGQ